MNKQKKDPENKKALKTECLKLKMANQELLNIFFTTRTIACPEVIAYRGDDKHRLKFYNTYQYNYDNKSRLGDISGKNIIKKH